MTIQSGAIPITTSVVAWRDLINRIAELSGHSPTLGVDSYNYKLSEFARFIAVLGEFSAGKKKDPIVVIQNASDLLNHSHFGFLFSGKIGLIFTTMEKTDLNVTSRKIEGGRLAVVTGTLGQWKRAIITILSGEATREVRSVFSQCLDFFYFLGLQEVWHDYRKRQTNDGLYLLEYKN